MRKLLLAFSVLCLTASVARAIPAKRGFYSYRQSDGTTINVELRGDEFHHSFVTEDGLTVSRDEKGDFFYRNVAGMTAVMAHNPIDRQADEVAFVGAQKQSMTMQALASSPSALKARRANLERRKSQVPHAGKARVPILLVEYKDKKMSNQVDDFVKHYTEGESSVHQYFVDQSNGKYDPQFDVFGIYTLSGNRSVYGGNNYYGNDKGIGKMVAEACDSASKAGVINWSDYDNDGDGECDVVIVVYAGVGEAQSSLESSVWPCQWSLASANYHGDGPGAKTYDGIYVDRFAVFNEIQGSSDYGKKLDGIGTFCHEFSHCLGLPDFYNTNYTNYYGMGSWSLMDYGCYNNNGETPIGYCGYEKDFMGWIKLMEPTPNTQYTLSVFNGKNDSTDQAIKVVSDINPNEYYVLENRQRQGWDKYIRDEGLLISHVSYIPSRWDENSVNNESVQLMTLFPADNSLSNYSESADLYGETNHELTNTSTPAAKLFMTASGLATGNAGMMDKPITEINLNEDGTVSLWFMKDANTGGDDENMLPELTAFSDVTSTSVMAHWTVAKDAESYALHVIDKSKAPKYHLLAIEDLSKGTTTWNKSMTGIYREPKYLRLGTGNSTGYIESKDVFDLTAYKGVSTVAVTGKTYASDDEVPMKVSLRDEQGAELVSKTIVLPKTNKDTTYVVVLGDSTIKKAKVRIESIENRKRILLNKVEVYGGDAQSVYQLRRGVIEEKGDSMERFITGITDTCYQVKGLQKEGTYLCEVKAIYADGTQSRWSERKEVTLAKEVGSHLGDVNEDGKIDHLDVTALINYILGLDPKPFNIENADVCTDRKINVSDVTALINLIRSTH